MPKARDAGKVAFSRLLTQPSADIVRVEGAECRIAFSAVLAQPSADIVRIEGAECSCVFCMLVRLCAHMAHG